jgi:hypothetical protein
LLLLKQPHIYTLSEKKMTKTNKQSRARLPGLHKHCRFFILLFFLEEKMIDFSFFFFT